MEDVSLNALGDMMNTWILPDDPIFSRRSASIAIELIHTILKNSCAIYKDNAACCFIPTFLYVNRFVQTYGKIRRKDVVELLMISAGISLKMYNDGGVNSEQFLYCTGLSGKDANLMERNFLSTVQFNLFIDPSEMISLH
jgi:cyclin-like protein